MKVFSQMELREGLAYSKSGGQALHLHKIIVDRKKAPKCFVRAIDRGEHIAHLFDLDKTRLIKTARSFGVRVLFIDHEGTDEQHIDLCGKPLDKALEFAHHTS